MRLLRRGLFWASLPLIAAQGLWLRRRAPRLDAAAGPDHGDCPGAAADAASAQLLALGDSIIAGVGVAVTADSLPAQLAAALAAAGNRRWTWQAQGRNGADSRELLSQWQAARREPAPDLVLLSIGVNDVTGLRWRSTFAANLAGWRGRLAAEAPQARLLVCAVPPLAWFPLLPQPLRGLLGLRAALLDEVLAAQFRNDPAALHAPMPWRPGPEQFAADGFHPQADAVSVWARELAARALAAWPDLAVTHTASAGQRSAPNRQSSPLRV